MPGEGELKSTANDLLTFLAAFLGDRKASPWHILRPGFVVATAAAKKAREQRKTIEPALEPKLLTTYAGQYRVAAGPTAGKIVTIERYEEVLVLKSRSTPPQELRLHAKNEHELFITEADLQAIFQFDSQGHVTGLLFRFARTVTAAPRIESAPAKTSGMNKER